MLDLRQSRASAQVPKQEQRRDVHTWLEAVSTAETFQKAESVRHEKTCNWIFTRPEYQDWESTSVAVGSPKILWIHSGPGFGKTVLCSRIIRHLMGNDVRLVYFFCVADEETKRQPYAILRSWIDQLTHNNEDALEIVYNMYKSIEPRGPTPTELWRIFKILSRYYFVKEADIYFAQCHLGFSVRPTPLRLDIHIMTSKLLMLATASAFTNLERMTRFQANECVLTATPMTRKNIDERSWAIRQGECTKC